MTTRGLGTLGRAHKASDNPYVGPRAFRRNNTLFGREREAQDLETLFIAERIVLLHAPSGAGKTSLIQAKLIPSLEQEFKVSGPLRVNAVPPQGSRVNPYLHSVMRGLAKGRHAPPALDTDADRGAFHAWLTELEQLNDITDHVLIFDQFEELIVLDPTDRAGQRAFCRQVGRALAAHHRWALFSMREDYMGGLDRYLELIPTQLRVRYRLDFLDRDAAKEAARQPAERRGVEFTAEAADVLVHDLVRRRIERPGRHYEEKEWFVEPVQLQVVCHTVWARLAEERGRAFTRIGREDVEGYNDFQVALGSYFANVVREAAQRSRVPESVIRRWFEEQLITARGFRSQTFEPPSHNGGNKDRLLSTLERRYLIRGDHVGDKHWYELSHDGLVEPIREDNRRWFREQAGPWMEFAWDWRAADKDRGLLLRGEALREATRWVAEHPVDAGELVREYVDASHEAATNEKLRRRVTARELLLARVSTLAFLLAVIAVLEFVYIVYLWNR